MKKLILLACRTRGPRRPPGRRGRQRPARLEREGGRHRPGRKGPRPPPGQRRLPLERGRPFRARQRPTSSAAPRPWPSRRQRDALFRLSGGGLSPLDPPRSRRARGPLPLRPDPPLYELPLAADAARPVRGVRAGGPARGPQQPDPLRGGPDDGRALAEPRAGTEGLRGRHSRKRRWPAGTRSACSASSRPGTSSPATRPSSTGSCRTTPPRSGPTRASSANGRSPWMRAVPPWPRPSGSTSTGPRPSSTGAAARPRRSARPRPRPATPRRSRRSAGSVSIRPSPGRSFSLPKEYAGLLKTARRLLAMNRIEETRSLADEDGSDRRLPRRRGRVHGPGRVRSLPQGTRPPRGGDDGGSAVQGPPHAGLPDGPRFPAEPLPGHRQDRRSPGVELPRHRPGGPGRLRPHPRP